MEKRGKMNSGFNEFVNKNEKIAEENSVEIKRT
jgi:hypothetical protein